MKTSMKPTVFFAGLFLLAGAAAAQTQHCKVEEAAKYRHVPSNGYVPDEAAAIAVAEAILVPIYGKESIEGQKPFLVSLQNDVWTVYGPLPTQKDKLVLGGVFRIQISQRDASVLNHTHGK